MDINPKVRDFLEEKKDLTLVGLAWAVYWRIQLIMTGVVLLLYLIAEIFK